MEKILVVAESIDVEDSSGSKANVALIENLWKAKFDLKVLHYTRKQIQLGDIPCEAIPENRNSLYFYLSRIERRLRKGLNIMIHEPLENSFGFSFTLFNDRDSIVESIKKGNDFEPDYILTLSKGGSFRPHHALLKLPGLHHKWIAYMHDPYPMHLYPPPFAWVEPGQFKKWEFVKNVSEKAAFPAFPSELLRDWMGSYFPGFLGNPVIIPHQISSDPDQEAELPEFFDPYFFNILHAGTLLEPRDPVPLTRAYKRLLAKHPEAGKESRLIFIGRNSIYKKRLKQLAEETNHKIIVSPGLDFRTVRRLQDLCAVNVILEAKSQISPFLPGKFPHCIQADRPILLLGPALSESRRLLGESYPYWAEVLDEERIFELLENMYMRWKQEREAFRLDREDLKEYLSYSHLGRVIKSLAE